MEINTEAQSVCATFGYETEEAMIEKLMDLEYAVANKREIALATAMLKLQDLGTEPTMLLMIILGTLTGLKIRGPGELIDYFNKSLKEEELVLMCSRITMVGDDNYKAREKEISDLINAMRESNS